jgi:predicted permease
MRFAADVRYAARLLRRAPGFTLAVVAVLALGIGANSAIFTALDRTVIRPLPYADPDRLTALWEDFSSFGAPKSRVSPATFYDWQKRTTTFESLAAYAGPRNLDLAEGGRPEEVLGESVTANLFPLLGVRPMLGRTFDADEERPDANAIMLSYRLWQRRFGGDRHLVGRAVRMNGLPYTVIGIMPPGFQYPDRRIEAWLRLGLAPALRGRRNSHFLYVVGRLRESRGVRAAQDEMNEIARQLGREFPATNRGIGIRVVPLKEEVLGQSRTAFIVLLLSAVCVLLIACANVSNLMLARAAGRAREFAVRRALGAGSAHLARQLITENLMLAAAGGAAGLLLADWGMPVLQRLVPPGLAGSVELRVDGGMTLAATVISAAAGLLFGLAPLVQFTRSGLCDALRGGAWSTASRGGRRLQGALVSLEMAVALVLLVGAGLLIESLAHLRAVDPGFRADGILTADITVNLTKYGDAARRQRFFQDVLDRVSAIPGVRSVGLTSDLPYTSRGNTMSLAIEGRPSATGLGRDALFRLVSHQYLQTMRARLIEGRLFDARDSRDSAAAVVISESLARLYWPGESPLGRRIDTGTGDGQPLWMTIVGVVDDLRERGLDLDAKPAVYVPFDQTKISFFQPSEIAVWSARAPASMVKELEQAVWSVDPEQPVSSIREMNDIVDEELGGRTQVLQLLGGFAALALVLAAVGIYGVLAYLVSQRRREIGLRMALGAGRWTVAAAVARQAAGFTVIGVIAGAAGASAATRLIATLLYGVSPLDLRTFAAVALLLVIVALAAAFVPARRAAAVSPAVALRE